MGIQVESPLEQTKVYKWYKRSAHWIKRVFIGFAILCVVLFLFLLYLRSQPLPPPDISATTFLYDDQGNVLDQMDAGEHREKISLEQIPKYLVDATLTAEDRDFFEHHGFSFRGITRALLVNLKQFRVVQGASTITQQLARNLYLSHDRTWSRKAKEAMLTTQLELHFNKKELLEMYFNEIYYGNGAYGIQRAAQEYFRKDAKDLNLAECTFLAGIPRGPSVYSPYQHFQRAKERQRSIIEQMSGMKLITKQQAKEASQYTLALQPPLPSQKSKASYFRDYVIQTAVNQLGFDEELVRHGGLRIYTTLNKQMQKQAEESLVSQVERVPNLQGALLSVDAHTGAIKAMVGGKSYQESQFNRVFARRQPGSSFKPIVYLTALEKGIPPTQKVVSAPTAFTYNGDTYTPGNFQDTYAQRPITMREAIAKSDNIYAVTTQFQVGIDQEIETARKLGIQSSLNATPSLALGSYEVTPYEMTEAYTTIASNGDHKPLTGISKIVDSFGHVLYQNQPESKQVFSPSSTYVLTSLMRSVFDTGGTGHRVQQMFAHPAAGKTGTTDWDGWLVGYTPDLVTTVWVGFDQNQKLNHNQAKISQHVWGRFMGLATLGKPSKIFAVPSGVKAVYIDDESGKLAHPDQKNARLEYFMAGTEPTEYTQAPESTNPEPSLWDRIKKWWSN
ncbi:1A family penicillin-binding protein [Croceifilum oryzae]|uniref:1A family penicillin-binding protein n=1 Tax=Croceifilum oryzae TaxID=1553429 RepID=A0AAJ1WUB1_9BACL|nr:PBP1A family penicillin-binding protein [Croceifilum oryzae]MDQ0417821.1 1A family penicillin-binding protein [Croceifilum oryzae]